MKKLAKALQITDRLHQCYDAAKNLHQDRFEERIKPFTDVIQAVMTAHKINEMKSLVLITKTETFKDDTAVQMMFFAATVYLLHKKANA
jgi:hypothetical protein